MTKIMHIKNNRPRIYTANEFDLHPGLNKVDETVAKEFLANPIIKVKVERGFIEVVKTVKQAEPKTTDDTDAKAAAAAKEKADKAAADKKAEQEKADADAKAQADKDAAAKAAAEEEKAKAAAAAQPDTDEQPEPPYGIKDLNAEDSIAKIKVIEDVDYLIRVANRENRKTVKEAAQDRVLALKGE